MSETTSETQLAARRTLSSAPAGQDIQEEKDDGDDGRRDSDYGDRRSGHDHAALISPLPPRETLSRERNGSRSRECHRKAGEDAEVGVKRDPLDATNAKGLQSVSLETRPVVILTPFGVLAWAAIAFGIYRLVA